MSTTKNCACSGSRAIPQPSEAELKLASYRIAVVGNPNCGKTTLFNALTGARQKVGNWPGVTIDRKEGYYIHDNARVSVIDLPGVYSLSALGTGGLDEAIARDFILASQAELIVNIVDAGNLERNLYLTAQLIEMRAPMIVALNMMDAAREQGLRIDIVALSERLGCPVVPLVASRGEGVEMLKAVIAAAAAAPTPPSAQLTYSPVIEEAIADLIPPVRQAPQAAHIEPRWLALKLLEGESCPQTDALAALAPQVGALREAVEAKSDEDIDILFADGRYGFANAIMRETTRRRHRASRSLTERIDSILLNRILGIPIFLGVMYLMFLFAINFAGAFVDFFDQFTGTILVDGGAALFAWAGAPDWLIALIPKGIGAGIQTVATFIPVVGFLFLFLTVLEDTGYMARAAFVMDRAMRAFGLPGKSFVPMVLGFGCTVPAVMAARTLENERERVLTVMMAPFMSCGARLPVYALFAAAFFPHNGQNLVFALYLIGVAAALLTGLALKRTMLRGGASPFIMELPPYRLPTLRALLLRVWDRLRAFMLEAGRVIVLIVMVLAFFNSLGTDGSFNNNDSDKSVLAAIGKTIVPAFRPMGVKEENWPAAVGLFTGIFAKEAVVGTLNSLYSNLAEKDAGTASAEKPFDFWGGIGAAFRSIPNHLRNMASAFGDPLGLKIANAPDTATAAQEQGVNAGIFGAMANRFTGQIGAFAYLLAILLYMPCVAATSAILREVGRSWGLFAVFWTTTLAYGGAVAAYQLGTFTRHPQSSSVWLAVIMTAIAAILVIMRWLGGRKGHVSSVSPAFAGGAE